MHAVQILDANFTEYVLVSTIDIPKSANRFPCIFYKNAEISVAQEAFSLNIFHFNSLTNNFLVSNVLSLVVSPIYTLKTRAKFTPKRVCPATTPYKSEFRS